MRLAVLPAIGLLATVMNPAACLAEVFEVPVLQEAMVRVESGGADVSHEMTPGPAIGDTDAGNELRALFGFDLSFLPPGAEITSAIFRARFSAGYGNPGSLGAVYAGRIYQIKGFPSADLQPQWATNSPVTPMADVHGEVAAGSDVEADLTAHLQGQYPSPQYHQDRGRAVVRIQFEMGSNGDSTGDFIYFSDSRLELDVELPDPIDDRPLGRYNKRCLPVVASLAGAAGTQWTTELHLTARRESSIWLYFTETETDGTTGFHVRRVDLDGWETLRYADVLPELFGLHETKGWIEVFMTDPDTAVTARVANVGGGGSYGQTVPLIDESVMLRGPSYRFWDRVQRSLNLIMSNADNRTNVGLVNLGPGEVQMEISARTSEGTFLGSYETVLQPFEHRQLDRVETLIPAAAGIGPLSLSVYALSDSTEMAAWKSVAAYASRVDNTTGDAVFVLPR